MFGVAAQPWLSAAPARAHAIESSLERLADLNLTLELNSRYSTGLPAAGARVSLVAPDGAELALGKTDAQGQLRFGLPAGVDSAWEVRVDQGPGHRDYLELPAAPTPGPAPRRPTGVDPLAAGGGTLLLLVGAVAVWPRQRR